MNLTTLEKNYYIQNVLLKNFSTIWQTKAVASTLFDTDGCVLAISDLTMEEFGIKFPRSIIGKSLVSLYQEDISRSLVTLDSNYAESIKQISLKLTKLQQIVIEKQTPLHYISLVPRHSEFKARLINYMPVFHENGEIIALQSFASEFSLFGINEYLDILQNKQAIHFSILTKESDLPIKFAPRQHEILFLLSIGLSQSNAAQILNISRGALAAVVNNVLCPKFGIAGSSTTILVDKAIAMNYHRYIPKSLCKPFIIILDQDILNNYFTE